MTSKHKAVALVVFVVMTFAAAVIGSVATVGSVEGWMESLRLPSWQPPSWVFGPVWTLLYLMMAVAGWLVYVRVGRVRSLPMALYGVQLVLNALWSVLFFGLRRPDLAAGEIVVLLASIIATMVVFWKQSVTAGALFVPYTAWVSFATVLNVTIWRMNA